MYNRNENCRPRVYADEFKPFNLLTTIFSVLFNDIIGALLVIIFNNIHIIIQIDSMPFAAIYINVILVPYSGFNLRVGKCRSLTANRTREFVGLKKINNILIVSLILFEIIEILQFLENAYKYAEM